MKFFCVIWSISSSKSNGRFSRGLKLAAPGYDQVKPKPARARLKRGVMAELSFLWLALRVSPALRAALRRISGFVHHSQSFCAQFAFQVFETRDLRHAS
jgi:hypothetical protein